MTRLRAGADAGPGVRIWDDHLDLRDGESAEIAVRGLTGAVADDELRARRGMRAS